MFVFGRVTEGSVGLTVWRHRWDRRAAGVLVASESRPHAFRGRSRPRPATWRRMNVDSGEIFGRCSALRPSVEMGEQANGWRERCSSCTRAWTSRAWSDGLYMGGFVLIVVCQV